MIHREATFLLPTNIRLMAVADIAAVGIVAAAVAAASAGTAVVAPDIAAAAVEPGMAGTATVDRQAGRAAGTAGTAWAVRDTAAHIARTAAGTRHTRG